MNGAEDDSGAQPEPSLLLVRGVVRSFAAVLLLTALGAVVGLVVGALQPNSYVSNAKLSLRMGAREQLTSESLVDFDARQRLPPPTMVDELQMLSDAALFESVARSLGPRLLLRPADPTRDDGPRTSAPVRWLHRFQRYAFEHQPESGPGPGEDELSLATKLLKANTTVYNEPGSSVILVSHTSSSPELARTVVDALAQAFIARHRAHFSIQALLERTGSELEVARQARDSAASAYVEQVSRSGIVALETQVPRLETELSALENEVFAARMRGEELGRLRASLESRLAGVPAEIEVQSPSVMVPNEDYETQLALKRLLLAQKQELSIRERPSEETRRRAKEYDNQIAKLDQQLKATPKHVVQGSELQENLGHAALASRILDLEVEEEALPVKLALLEARLNAKKERLGEFQKQLLTAAMLRKDLSAAREAGELRYTRLQDHLSVLVALENIDAEEEANLRVLQAATLEREKVAPKRGSLLIKGLLAGLFVALAFAVLRQRFDRRLRHPEHFANSSGIPVLAVVPRLSSLRGLRERVALGRD